MKRNHLNSGQGYTGNPYYTEEELSSDLTGEITQRDVELLLADLAAGSVRKKNRKAVSGARKEMQMEM